MKNLFYIFLFTLISVNLSFSQQLWINELSYDCADSSDGSLDGDEFIEIVAPVGTDMSNYALIFFNSPDAGVYSIYAYAELSGTISSTNSNYGYGFHVFTTGLSHRLELYTPIPNGIEVQPAVDNLNSTGIDNGPYAGIILVNKNNSETIHAVLYEFDKTRSIPTEISNDPDGMVKIDGPFLLNKNKSVIPFSLADFENSTPNRGLIMIGNGTSGLWTMTTGLNGSVNTPGEINYSQGPLPVELSSFSANEINNGIKLNWRTETEVNNYGFDVERKSANGDWDKITFVNGSGNSNSPKDYTYTDNTIKVGRYSYRLKQIDNDGKYAFSKVVEVTFNKISDYSLAQNYPNPFNPSTIVSFTLPESGNVKLTIYNLLGQEIKTLVNGYKESGVYDYSFDATELNSGVYVYRLETNNFSQTRKMTLVK